MSELQDLSFFNSYNSEQKYPSNSLHQKLLRFVRKWWILILLFSCIFMIFVAVFVIIGHYENEIQTYKEFVDILRNKNFSDNDGKLLEMADDFETEIQNQIRDQNRKFDDKFNILESKIERQNSKLDSKVNRQITDLEDKIQDQIEVQNNEFDDKINRQVNGLESNLKAHIAKQVTNVTEKFDKKIAFQTKAASARSCKELYDHGFKTGKYRIDPDARYGGTSSFEATCDFEYNLTYVSPKNEIFRLGFYRPKSFYVNYLASLDQLQSLIGSSGSCYQNVYIVCTQQLAKLILPSNEFWWLDNHGKPYFVTMRYPLNNTPTFLFLQRMETIFV